MFSLPGEKPCDTNISVVLLHIKDRNTLYQTFCIYILLGVFLCHYAKVRVNISVTPTGERVLCLTDGGLFLQLG